ncbi:DUF1634 domain-containing protein [Acinetobacter sp. S40]|uniref:DUF1634 domain-containing protein n=1 Tax=unclassified Acinetobacter TaxID=196816 RepID=UPI00190D84C6|nr:MULTISPECIES: DUF1634 domain-containing protein [unclassified Acinetobacter]MBJ9985021.1 DUF1634 domain-containing protein [Acinetobacter sp. S40]MBK0062988.1 DUF1634 domain-containing protein [Acinetobacter sp. S55]MBK0066594.1 DUF1634 domain-containing protein [Acinetobacter sp. S54]
MSIIFGIVLIVMGMYILYVLSSKQLEKTKKSKLQFLAHNVKIMRIFAFILFLIAGLFFIAAYGSSIGFISWWIFATPLVFGIILYINDLKPKADNRHKPSRSHRV